MAAQRPQPTELDAAGSSVTRRGLFKRAAVAGGTMVAAPAAVDRIAPRYSPIGRAAALDAGKVALVAATGVAGLVAGYNIGGDDDAAEEINEARANELHDRIWLDGREMQMTQTPLLESLAGDVTMLRQICRSDAAFALMQAASDQKSESDATADGKAAVEDAVANVEANFFDAWSSQLVKIKNRAELVNSEEELILADAFQWLGATSDVGSMLNVMDPSLTNNGEAYQATADLVNGETHSVEVLIADIHDQTFLVPWSEITATLDNSQDFTAWETPYEHFDEDGVWDKSLNSEPIWGITVKDRESGNTLDALDAYQWMQIHDELLTLVSEEKANVETMVDTMYQDALDGELALHEMSSASVILQNIDEMDTWKQAAGAYRAMVMPEATDPAVVELENGVELEGLLFWSDPDPDNGLPVGETTNPDNTIGRLYMAAEIRSVPEPPEDELHDVTLTVVDDDTDATALEGITVEMKGSSDSWTTDSNGEVTLEASEGPTTFYLSGQDSGGASHDTGITVEVSSDNTSFEITHDGSDRTSLNMDPFDDQTLTNDDEGSVVIPYLTDPFEVVGIHERPAATNLLFEEPDRVEPDDGFQKQVENSKRAAEQEEKTREETTTIVIEKTSNGGPGPIFGGGDLFESGGRMLGLGIIVFVVLTVVGIVTDAIPGLGN